MLRRLFQIVMLAGAVDLANLPAADGPCDAAVVYRSGSSAYDDALRGIRETLSGGACHVRYVDLEDPAASRKLDTALGASPKLVVAVGVGAYQQLRAGHPSLNLLPALILRGDLASGPTAKVAGAVYADVPLPVILERLHALFPKRRRVALIRRPSWPVLDTATKDRARQMGFDLRVVECAGPDKLLAAFTSLKGAADFVIADPDPELFNNATLKPLVLASLDQRLPLTGFSPAFVHAGALVGVYPDFQELGRQAGQMAAAILAGRASGSEEDVRKVKVAMNQQISRLLGIDPERQEEVEVFK